MKYCMRCGGANEDDARYCVSCGNELGQPPVKETRPKEDGTVLLGQPPVKETQPKEDGTVLLGQPPVKEARPEENGTVLLGQPPVKETQPEEDGTVLLGQPPVKETRPKEDGTVLLGQPPVKESRPEEDGTVLLGQPPVKEARPKEDGTVLLGQPPVKETRRQASEQQRSAQEGTATECLFEEPAKEESSQAYLPPIKQGPLDVKEEAPATFQPKENTDGPKEGKKKRRGLLITLICVGVVALLGVLTAVFFWMGATPSASPLQEALQLGEKYMDDLNYENAVAAYSEAIEIDPMNTDAYLGLAQSYMGAEQYDEAEASYQQLLELDAANAQAYRELAELYIRLDKLQEAKQLLEAAVQAVDDPDIEELYQETTPKAPAFSLQPGSYDQRQEVSILPDQDTHVIHYTTDGSKPTEDSPVFQEPIILKNGETTIKAVAVSSRGYVSDLSSATYTITVEQVEITFEDAAVERAVRDTLQIGYGPLYNEDVEQITELSIVGGSSLEPGETVVFTQDSYTIQSSYWERSSLGQVATLNDLKYMPFLRRLHLAFQESTDISGIASAARLEELSLIHVGLTDLSPVSGLTGLKKLCVGWNQVSDLSPVANLTSLVSLGVWNNSITDLTPVQNLKALTYLDFSANQVSDISPVANLDSLCDLWMYQNQVSDFQPLEGLMQLRVLMIRDNPISDKTSLQKVFPRLGRTDVDVIDRGGETA